MYVWLHGLHCNVGVWIWPYLPVMGELIQVQILQWFHCPRRCKKFFHLENGSLWVVLVGQGAQGCKILIMVVMALFSSICGVLAPMLPFWMQNSMWKQYPRFNWKELKELGGTMPSPMYGFGHQGMERLSSLEILQRFGTYYVFCYIVFHFIVFCGFASLFPMNLWFCLGVW